MDFKPIKLKFLYSLLFLTIFGACDFTSKKEGHAPEKLEWSQLSQEEIYKKNDKSIISRLVKTTAGQERIIEYKKADKLIFSAKVPADFTNLINPDLCSHSQYPDAIILVKATFNSQETDDLDFEMGQVVTEDKLVSLQDSSNLSCQRDCNSSQYQYTEACQNKIPCGQQDPIMATDKCIKEHFCPVIHMGEEKQIIAIALKAENSFFAVVSFDQNKKLQAGLMGAIASYKTLTDIKTEIKHEVTHTVSYDGVESDRCYFSYQLSNKNPDEGIYTNRDPQTINKMLRIPTAEEKSLFASNFNLCSLPDCSSSSADDEGFEWKKHSLIAITDLNADGNLEYWSFYVDGYRRWYVGSEYDAKNKVFNQFFHF